MRVKVVSFATTGEYDREADRLRESAKRFNVDINVVTYSRDFLPTWFDAVKFKPRFIAEQLALWSDDYSGVLWSDADSEFVAAPDWDTFDACHAAWHRFKRSKMHEEENLTGTMFFAPSTLTKHFLHDWIAATEAIGKCDTPEQRSLKAVMAERRESFIAKDMPASYVWIFDDFPALYPGVKPVVIHRQASRIHKNEARPS